MAQAHGEILVVLSKATELPKVGTISLTPLNKRFKSLFHLYVACLEMNLQSSYL